MKKILFTLLIISIFAVSCTQSDTSSQIPEGEYIQGAVKMKLQMHWY